MRLFRDTLVFLPATYLAETTVLNDLVEFFGLVISWESGVSAFGKWHTANEGSIFGRFRHPKMLSCRMSCA